MMMWSKYIAYYASCFRNRSSSNRVRNRAALHWLEAKLLPLLHSTYIVIGVLLYMLGGILLRERVQTRATVGDGLFAFAASRLVFAFYISTVNFYIATTRYVCVWYRSPRLTRVLLIWFLFIRQGFAKEVFC